MKIQFKNISFGLALVVSIGVFPTLVFPQNEVDPPLKIGYVNAQEVVSNAPQANIALEQLTQKYSAREAELLEMQNQLRDLENRLRDPQAAELSEAELAELRGEARLISRELERASTDLNEDYNFDRNRRLEELQSMISEVILQMAREEGFDLIVQSPVVWASQRIDITNAVLERLQEIARQ